MPRRNKLQKFAEVRAMPNVYESFDPTKPELTGVNGQVVDLRGRWCRDHYENGRPLTLELACGRGEYTLELARRYPERNFLGVDIKGARIWRGAKTALEENLGNAAFLRTRIEVVTTFFAPGEADEIWITFPDPFHKKPNRRLTSPNFLRQYQKLLRPGGKIYLKTDSRELYEYTLEILAETPFAKLEENNENIYAGPLPMPELDIPTYYERMHRGKPITYIRFTLMAPASAPG